MTNHREVDNRDAAHMLSVDSDTIAALKRRIRELEHENKNLCETLNAALDFINGKRAEEKHCGKF